MVVFSSAFGLRICSDQPIPGLVPASEPTGTDIRVRLSGMPLSATKWNDAPSQIVHVIDDDTAGSEPLLRVWRVAGGAYFRYRYIDGTEFLIDRLGRRVWMTWKEPLTVEDAATYFLGPVIGFVLRLRGVVCLHASAVAVDDRALVLLGSAGAGKSTTAAAFAQLGYPVISDDIVGLREHSCGFFVRPGIPRLRLWPKSVHTLFGASDALPPLTPNWEKCYLDMTPPRYRREDRSLPAGAVYVFRERSSSAEAPRVTGLDGGERVLTLLANTYPNCTLDRTKRAEEFAQLGRLATTIPIRQATPHVGAQHLFDLCQVILDDFNRLSGDRVRGACNAACGLL
jgi:hypothetical protein